MGQSVVSTGIGGETARAVLLALTGDFGSRLLPKCSPERSQTDRFGLDPRAARCTLFQANLQRILQFAALCCINPPIIGAAGFEPATPCSQSRCATRLRHAPCA